MYYSTDYNGPCSHMNPSDARKVTDHLGQYISGNYGIADYREDAIYSSCTVFI